MYSGGLQVEPAPGLLHRNEGARMSATEASASIQNAANPMEMKCINTIRTLSMDAVQAANSGHPGTPMSMAPLAYCLWQEFLRYDPKEPLWTTLTRLHLYAVHP